MEKKINFQLNKTMPDNYNVAESKDFLFCTEEYHSSKIKHVEQKKISNIIVQRNIARTCFSEVLIKLINLTESQSQFLTAADRREFHEVFTSIVKEI